MAEGADEGHRCGPGVPCAVQLVRGVLGAEPWDWEVRGLAWRRRPRDARRPRRVPSTATPSKVGAKRGLDRGRPVAVRDGWCRAGRRGCGRNTRRLGARPRPRSDSARGRSGTSMQRLDESRELPRRARRRSDSVARAVWKTRTDVGTQNRTRTMTREPVFLELASLLSSRYVPAPSPTTLAARATLVSARFRTPRSRADASR